MAKYFFYCLVLVSGLCGCRKQEVPAGNLPEGTISISFDDTYIDNWHNALPLLDSLNIKATFYISSYHTMNNHQKRKLRTIESQGHEIGYHTTNHNDLVKLYTSRGLQKALETEVNPDLKLMRKDGFNPENFAYPFGQRDACLDKQLLTTFKSVRGVCNPKTYNKSLVKEVSASPVFFAPSIDTKSKITDSQVETLIRNASENHLCVMFYAHAINKPTVDYQVTTQRLLYIASLAQKYNMRFVTVREMTR